MSGLSVLAAGLVTPVLLYLRSFAAGAMIYVLVEELVPEMAEGEHSNAVTILFAAGFTLVVALGVAVYLNWEYAKTDAPFALQDPGAVSANAAVETVTDGTTSGVLDALPVQEALPDKNYGDAQLVSANETSNDKYFEQARLTRSKTRDEALDTMQQALKNAELSETEKTAVTQTLTNTINSITVESDIENMVKAKGFADCVAFIEGEKINLAVKTGSEGLDKSEVAQLRDIILGKMETEAKNISIVEVK